MMWSGPGREFGAASSRWRPHAQDLMTPTYPPISVPTFSRSM